MRNDRRKNTKFIVIIIITALICAGLLLAYCLHYINRQSGNISADTTKEVPMETSEPNADVKPITEITIEEPGILEHQDEPTINASRQSSLEKAIDDLIILTEPEDTEE